MTRHASDAGPRAPRAKRERTSTAAARPFARKLYAPMILGAILNPINSSIMAVALVPIGAAFGAPVSETVWLVSALYLSTAVGQPLVGRLVDMYGPKPLFLVGASLTIAAGVVGILAPSIWVLVAARVVLGFGTCAGYPSAMSLIRRESQRTGVDRPAAVLTVLSVSTQTIAVVGPTLGGVLIELGGWRSTFAVNIPLGLASLLLGLILLPSGRGAEQRARTRLDLVGVVLFAAMLLALLLFLMNLQWTALPLLAVALAVGAGFAFWELRRADPFIEVRVLAGNAPLLATYGRTLLQYAVSYSFTYGFTQWMQEDRGLSPAVAGLILLPTFAIGILVATLTGRFAEVRLKLIVGNAAQIAVCVALLFLTPDSPIWFLAAITGVLGVPQGLLSLANQNALYRQAHPARIGASAGLLRTFMYLGAIVASSATGFLFGARATTDGLHELAIFMLVVACGLMTMILVDRSLARVGRPAS